MENFCANWVIRITQTISRIYDTKKGLFTNHLRWVELFSYILNAWKEKTKTKRNKRKIWNSFHFPCWRSGEGNHTLKGWMDTWTHECVNAIMHSHMSELMDVCVHLKLINKEMSVSVGMNWLEEGGKLGTRAIDSINNFISSQNRCSSMLCPSTKRCQTGFTRKGYRCVCANGLLGENCTEGMLSN